uniref:Transmembrane protein 88B n=1 Tax=Rousettus aegyptiacus TaxID=9407 RepID=A0A7J8KIP9_ROUAE|nr:transmembrane protein 88B [Rousettus aegyptiacus]
MGATRPTACESMSEEGRETEEDEGGSFSDTAPMLPQRLPDHQASARMSAGWAGLAAQGLGPLLLPGRVLAGLLLHLLLPATVFLLVLLPAAAPVYLGFLCHSKHVCSGGRVCPATPALPARSAPGPGGTIPMGSGGSQRPARQCCRPRAAPALPGMLDLLLFLPHRFGSALFSISSLGAASGQPTPVKILRLRAAQRGRPLGGTASPDCPLGA